MQGHAAVLKDPLCAWWREEGDEAPGEPPAASGLSRLSLLRTVDTRLLQFLIHSFLQDAYRAYTIS